MEDSKLEPCTELCTGLLEPIWEGESKKPRQTIKEASSPTCLAATHGMCGHHKRQRLYCENRKPECAAGRGDKLLLWNITTAALCFSPAPTLSWFHHSTHCNGPRCQPGGPSSELQEQCRSSTTEYLAKCSERVPTSSPSSSPESSTFPEIRQPSHPV